MIIYAILFLWYVTYCLPHAECISRVSYEINVADLNVEEVCHGSDCSSTCVIIDCQEIEAKRQFEECSSSGEVSHGSNGCVDEVCINISDSKVCWLPIVLEVNEIEYKDFLCNEYVDSCSVDNNVHVFECFTWVQHISYDGVEQQHILQVDDRFAAQISFM